MLMEKTWKMRWTEGLRYGLRSLPLVSRGWLGMEKKKEAIIQNRTENGNCTLRGRLM